MVILSDHDDSASTSSSSATSLKRKWRYDNKYDVFLSFRGSDTRQGFTDHLYYHLKQAGIQPFRDDDEFERGESLDKQLDNAIKKSSVSIIVFSENYASSRWCLDELVKILEQKKVRDHKVIPVFYKVDPSDVRHQRGSYKEAFTRYTEKGTASFERIQGWKAGLTQAANFSGLTLNKDGRQPETEFIAEIVSEVEKHLPTHKALDVPEHILGMCHWDEDLNSWFRDRTKDNNVLVICGTGGIGKTTIAKHLFNEYFQEFEGCCFLSRINARWGEIGVCGLQSRLLSNILNKREKVRINDCDEGTLKIKRALCDRNVLVVLDDVGEREQLEALFGHPKRLCTRSKILVTTRNLSLQKNFMVQPKVHSVEPLNDKDSLELFSWHAFRQLLPVKEYSELSKRILMRCEGLPLALKVLGSSLRERLDTKFWEKQLQKWDMIPNPGIQKVMQISYDSLEDNMVKSIFLHLACFFVGEKEDRVVEVLDHCGLHAMVGIQNLIDRCLIKKVNSNSRLMSSRLASWRLVMHQVIQDMGREIVRKEFPEEPGRRSRLFCHEDSFAVLKYDTGTEAVQSLILDGKEIYKVDSYVSSSAATDAIPRLLTNVLGYIKNKKEVILDRLIPSRDEELIIDAFAMMKNLLFVRLSHVHLSGSCNKFPEKLRWISWHGFPLEYIPMELPLKNLVALDLKHSLLKQVWKEYKEVKSLKFVNLSYSLQLRQTPDFRGLLQLEVLILKGCSNLVKVCKTIGILKGLKVLNVRDCLSLRDLPALPQSIVNLDLVGCNLGEFPGNCKTNNRSFYAILKFASPSIARGPLMLLSFLPHSLVKLNLSGCKLSDECFPRSFNGLCSLENLDLSKNLISRLPDCIRDLSNSRLNMLNIWECPQLQSIIHPPSSVTYMQAFGNRQLQRVEARKIQSRKAWSLVFLPNDDPTVIKYIASEGCLKRVEAGNVQRKVIKNLGLESVPGSCVGKIQYEVGIFSTIVRSTKVPYCFTTYTYDDQEEKVEYGGVESREIGTSCKQAFIIPSSSLNGNGKSQALNMCWGIRLDLQREKYLFFGYFKIIATVCNKTKDLAWSYRLYDRFEKSVLLEKYEERKGHTFTKFLWVSTWKCEVDLLEAGDELQVSIDIEPIGDSETVVTSIEQCGIRIVYENDDLDDYCDQECLLLWADKMDISFSNYCTPGTTYFLRSHLYFLIQYVHRYTFKREIQELVSHVDDTVVKTWTVPLTKVTILRSYPPLVVLKIRIEYDKRWCSSLREAWLKIGRNERNVNLEFDVAEKER